MADPALIPPPTLSFPKKIHTVLAPLVFPALAKRIIFPHNSSFSEFSSSLLSFCLPGASFPLLFWPLDRAYLRFLPPLAVNRLHTYRSLHRTSCNDNLLGKFPGAAYRFRLCLFQFSRCEYNTSRCHWGGSQLRLCECECMSMRVSVCIPCQSVIILMQY